MSRKKKHTPIPPLPMKENQTLTKENKTPSTAESQTLTKENKTPSTAESQTLTKENKTPSTAESQTLTKENKTPSTAESQTLTKENKTPSTEENETLKREEDKSQDASFWKTIYMSIFQPEYYKVLYQIPLKSALSFIGVFILCLSFCYTSLFSYKTAQFMNKIISLYDRGMPEVTIENGILTTGGEMPFIIYLEENNPDSDAVIIDTTGTVKDLTDYKKGILLTRDKIYTKRSEKDIKVDSLKDFMKGMPQGTGEAPTSPSTGGVQKSSSIDGVQESPSSAIAKESLSQGKDRVVLNKKFFEDIKQSFFKVWIMFLLLILLLHKTVSVGIQVSIFALLGMLLSRFEGKGLGFKENTVIGIYCIVPPSLIILMSDILGIREFFPPSGYIVLYYVIYLIYLILAHRSISSQEGC